MKRALAFAALLAAAWSGAQTPLVYAPGRNIADQGITVRNWGSGSIAETDEMAFEGVWSVRVSTRNSFQGGRMLFGKPVDLSGPSGDKNNLLTIVYRMPETASLSGGGGGAAGGDSRGGGSADMGAAGGEDGGAGKARGGGGGSSASLAAPRNMRVIITTTDGKKSEAYLPLPRSGTGTNWRQLAIPRQAISGFDQTNRTVKELAFAADATSTFWIGEIKISNDSTPITGEPNVRELNLGVGQEVVFTANGFGGASQLKYEWCFEVDGQVDAEGQAVRRRFRKPGNYTITLIISDAHGLKAPYKTNIKVTVNG